MATFYFNNWSNDGLWETVAVYYTGSFAFSGQPADGDTVSLYGLTYEFDSDESTSAGTPVAIGADLAATLDNLVTALMTDFSGSDGVTITSTGSAVNISVSPTYESLNSFSASSSVITVNDLSGGSVGNWSLNTFNGPQATSLPTSTDDVVANASITGNGSTVANFTLEDTIGSGIVFSGELTVTGVATFIGGLFSSYRASNEGTINGDAIFLNANNGEAGTVNGDVVFGDASSWGTNYGYIDGNAVFNGSWNGEYWLATTPASQGYVTGDAEFNSGVQGSGGQYSGSLDSISYGGVGGTATFNGNSYVAGGYCPVAIFNDTSSLGYLYFEPGASWGVVGTATFNDYSYIAATATYNFRQCIISGATFRGNSRNDLGLDPAGQTTAQIAYDKGINGSSILGVV